MDNLYSGHQTTYWIKQVCLPKYYSRCNWLNVAMGLILAIIYEMKGNLY